MRNPWKVLTGRGKVFLLVGLLILLLAMFSDQRDVLRIGLLFLVLPLVAGVLVARSRLRMSCERSVEPAQVPLGSRMQGKLLLGQDGRLPAGILLLEDYVPRELGSRPRFVVDKADLAWRRQVAYPLRGKVRGRFATGPLMVRTTDPFGLVRLDRQFNSTSEVMVTPEIVPLQPARGAGGGGSSGEARPHRIGVVGQDDVLVREYRQGDDVRRIHWRSTARRNELMVRREEQAWDPSTTIILDSRRSAHDGRGMDHSFEWAVSAAGSIAHHFLEDGFSVEVYDAEGPMHVTGPMGQHSSLSSDQLIRQLTDLTLKSSNSLHYGVEAALQEQNGQLVVAVVGRLTARDAESLLRARRNRAQGMALVVDADSFLPDGAEPTAPFREREQDLAVQMLIDNQWRVLRVQHGTPVAEAWQQLTRVGELV